MIENPETGEEKGVQSEYEIRLGKRAEMLKKGINPYAFKFTRSHKTSEIKENETDFVAKEQAVEICGKVYSVRAHGGSIFADLADFSGKLQIYAKSDELGEEKFKIFEEFVGTGDFLGVKGKVFKTKKGELSVLISDFEILSKALRPTPASWYGLSHTEKRFRERYLDILLNEDVKTRFKKRAQIMDAIRDTLRRGDFLEIETPVLHPIYGGANARPFKTYYESLKQDFYLRISNELYLKRAIVGNLEKVFEFSRDFRNEGIDATHNPEFTMIEIYEAYKDYNDFLELTKELILKANAAAGNSEKILWGEKQIDLGGQWPKKKLNDLLKEKTGLDVLNFPEIELQKYAESIGLKMPPKTNWGVLVDKIFTAKVEPTLINPTFVIDYPVEISPLAKRHRNEEKLTERFELYIGGKEIANGFSELTDPVEQRARFEEEQKHRTKGDLEAHPLDEDFILAQEYGMPPTAGVGIGIDRLAMLLTNAVNIREVIMFPQLKS
ncbi:MAG: lysine--tRNA ligase [bacterium]|nr:lysine--tRNA ligase [bacterium]